MAANSFITRSDAFKSSDFLPHAAATSRKVSLRSQVNFTGHCNKAGRVLRLHEPRAVTLDTSAVAFNGSISIYSAFTLIGILSLEPLSPLVQVTILQY
ncbi:hypothetical protein PISMIDRAFT_679150 [Pisolithus microcarpus 441]|uniref:Uncharacterized protein n=1 Tax=Pisolithus microcarpus 441 TaxID=765257 RepID=A0A0C9ZCM4_9AGAM|nr:hypothetical protein PISMIDRAFT_679150 [Pisolithus microcarpus 441]